MAILSIMWLGLRYRGKSKFVGNSEIIAVNQQIKHGKETQTGSLKGIKLGSLQSWGNDPRQYSHMLKYNI